MAGHVLIEGTGLSCPVVQGFGSLKGENLASHYSYACPSQGTYNCSPVVFPVMAFTKTAGHEAKLTDTPYTALYVC